MIQYSYNELYHSEIGGGKCYSHNQEESQKLYVLKKPDTKENILHDSSYIKFYNRQN